MKPKLVFDENSKSVEEVIIPPGKKRRYIEIIKISKVLNNSTVSKFVTRKSIGVNHLSGDQYVIW